MQLKILDYSAESVGLIDVYTILLTLSDFIKIYFSASCCDLRQSYTQYKSTTIVFLKKQKIASFRVDEFSYYYFFFCIYYGDHQINKLHRIIYEIIFNFGRLYYGVYIPGQFGWLLLWNLLTISSRMIVL